MTPASLAGTVHGHLAVRSTPAILAGQLAVRSTAARHIVRGLGKLQHTDIVVT